MRFLLERLVIPSYYTKFNGSNLNQCNLMLISEISTKYLPFVRSILDKFRIGFIERLAYWFITVSLKKLIHTLQELRQYFSFQQGNISFSHQQNI